VAQVTCLAIRVPVVLLAVRQASGAGKRRRDAQASHVRAMNMLQHHRPARMLLVSLKISALVVPMLLQSRVQNVIGQLLLPHTLYLQHERQHWQQRQQQQQQLLLPQMESPGRKQDPLEQGNTQLMQL